MSRSYEQDLMTRGIPYKIVRGVSFYERREVKDVLSYMRFSVNPLDGAALNRIGNVPPRGLGPKSLQALELDRRIVQQIRNPWILAMWFRQKYLLKEGAAELRNCGYISNFVAYR